MRTLFENSCSDWRIGFAIAAALALGAGIISGLLTPRGPVTSSQAIWSMATAFAIGLVAGLVTGNRWSILFTPVVFMIAFELARLGVDGPTVDSIHLGSTYGLITLISLFSGCSLDLAVHSLFCDSIIHARYLLLFFGKGLDFMIVSFQTIVIY
jgi:hypothetical protein